jgi:hypothetical protein
MNNSVIEAYNSLTNKFNNLNSYKINKLIESLNMDIKFGRTEIMTDDYKLVPDGTFTPKLRHPRMRREYIYKHVNSINIDTDSIELKDKLLELIKNNKEKIINELIEEELKEEIYPGVTLNHLVEEEMLKNV